DFVDHRDSKVARQTENYHFGLGHRLRKPDRIGEIRFLLLRIEDRHDEAAVLLHAVYDLLLDLRQGTRLAHHRPTRWISHSSVTPWLSDTRRRTSSPRVSMSALVASPVFIRKLACFSLTCAPPIRSPRQPAASTSRHALSPGGFLKVEPPVLLRSGCVSSRAWAMRSISAPISFGSPGAPLKRAATTIAPSGKAEWR